MAFNQAAAAPTFQQQNEWTQQKQNPSALSLKEPQDVVTQAQISPEELLSDFDSIVIKALKLGLQLQLEQMISSESNLIKILTQKSSQEALVDPNVAASFVPQVNYENGFILDKLKKFQQILGSSTNISKQSFLQGSNIERSDLSYAQPQQASKSIHLKRQMQSNVISSMQDVIFTVIKKATANVSSPSKKVPVVDDKNRNEDDDDEDNDDDEEQVVDIGDMNLQLINDLNDPNLSCDVNVKRDLNNESNLIMEEIQNLNQSTQVHADGGQLTWLDRHPSKVQEKASESKNEAIVSGEKPEKQSVNDHKIEYTEDLQQFTEVTSSKQIFMENSNIIDLSKIPKSVVKKGQGQQQQISEKKSSQSNCKKSYLIRQIYSSYDQYYDHGQKFKQIESLLGKRRVHERLERQPYQRTLRSSRQGHKQVNMSQTSRASQNSKQIQLSNINVKLIKIVPTSQQIDLNKNIKFIDQKSASSKAQKLKQQQNEDSQDSKLAVTSQNSSENKVESSLRGDRARRAEKREKKKNQKMFEMQAKQFATYASAVPNYNNFQKPLNSDNDPSVYNSNKEQQKNNACKTETLEKQSVRTLKKSQFEPSTALPVKTLQEHVSLPTSQMEAPCNNNRQEQKVNSNQVHQKTSTTATPVEKDDTDVVNGNNVTNITATTLNVETKKMKMVFKQKALTDTVSTPVIEPSLKAEVKFQNGGIPEFQTLDVTTNKVSEPHAEPANKDFSDGKKVHLKQHLSPEYQENPQAEEEGEASATDLNNHEAKASLLKEPKNNASIPVTNNLGQHQQILNESYNCRLFEDDDILEHVESIQEFKPLIIDDDPQSQHHPNKNSTSKKAQVQPKQNQPQ